MENEECLGRMQWQVLRDKELRASAKAVWQVLAHNPSWWSDTKAMFKVAEDSQMCIETVRKGIKALIEKGYVKRDKAFKSRFGYYYSIPLDD